MEAAPTVALLGCEIASTTSKRYGARDEASGTTSQTKVYKKQSTKKVLTP